MAVLIFGTAAFDKGLGVSYRRCQKRMVLNDSTIEHNDPRCGFRWSLWRWDIRDIRTKKSRVHRPVGRQIHRSYITVSKKCIGLLTAGPNAINQQRVLFY